jgi:epoxyqueuosine reductase
MTNKILIKLEEKGYKSRIVAARHVNDLRNDIERFHSRGLFDQDFYQERITFFKFDLDEVLPEINSLIVVAAPRPQVKVTFTWQGKKISLIIPPTYIHYDETYKQAGEHLSEILDPLGYNVVQATLPLKLLAVHSGLAKYGKNNVSYITGLGSFYQLAAYFSNLLCEEDNWQELQAIERCEKCSACRRNCPTGAIKQDRFLLHAENCLTYLNEKPGHIPFPEWLDLSSHNCLIGCLHCQRSCPENKGVLHWTEQGAEFTEEETALFLEGVSLDQLPGSTVRKLKQHDMVDYLDVFPRNLGVFLNNHASISIPIFSIENP